MNLSNIALKCSTRLRKYPLIHDIVRNFYCVFRPGIRFRLEKLFRNYDEIFVMKIGANDGVEGDSLAEVLLNDRRYRGVLVEPIPQYAKMLSDNYESTGRFKVERAAITADEGKLTMYFVDQNATEWAGEPIPKWMQCVASLDRQHVEKHLPPDMRVLIKEMIVDCISVPTLLKRNAINNVDLLHIDTEGHDYVVLQQFDFSEIRPKAVLFERKHLTKQDELSAKKLMEDSGYVVIPLEVDFLCIAN